MAISKILEQSREITEIELKVNNFTTHLFAGLANCSTLQELKIEHFDGESSMTDDILENVHEML